MKYTYALVFFLCQSWMLLAQDNYHSNLQSNLSSNYGLPSGTWIFTDNEEGNYSNISNWGGTRASESVTGQAFSRLSQMTIGGQGNNPWDSGWKINNNTSIQQGDKVLLVFWVRAMGESGLAKLFIEHATNFSKEIYLDVNITDSWVQYSVPFESTGSYNANGLAFGFHLATQQQVVQIGGFTAINFGQQVNLDQIPSDFNNELYGGHEADAPWRAAAAARIEEFRKADLTIEALDGQGNPVEDAQFEIEMMKHEFAFGSAITAARIAGNNNQNAFYENKIRNLDGKGHGFNWVVFENDLKWDGWEEEWFVSHDELVNAVSWLREQDIQIRGHNLVWPGLQYLPDDIFNNVNNADYVWNRINGRLEEILNYPGLKGNIPEWDVLNEIVVNTSLEPTFANVPGNTTGRELYADIFKRVREISPETKLYLNDYVTLTLNNTGGGQYDLKKARIQELLDAGAPLDGIGFQGHIGGFPNGIPSVLATLDDFYDSFGLTAKITEFDLPPIVSEELGAKYLEDFLTAVFSHVSMDGFLFWNFWDVATWQNPGANLFREDWSQTPAGDTFIDLVFNRWWTDTTAVTDTDGLSVTRAFKGKYQITYFCGGETVRDTIDLTTDEKFTINCDNLQTNTEDLSARLIDFRIYPNPAQEVITIERTENSKANLSVMDALGHVMKEVISQDALFLLNVEDLSPGLYFIRLQTNEGHGFRKMIID